MEKEYAVYGCVENHRIVTQQIAEGTIPHTFKCCMHGCNAFMSKLFRLGEGEQPIKATHEWYKQNINQYMLPGEKQAILLGKLSLRQISGNQETLSL